jgi:hypothetical protein
MEALETWDIIADLGLFLWLLKRWERSHGQRWSV